MGPERHRRWKPSVALAAGLLAASCTTGVDPDPQADPGETSRPVAREVLDDTTGADVRPDRDTSSVFDDPELNPEGIINAAVLLNSGGDVDVAVQAGAFTRDELEAARAALADGSLAYLFD